MANAESTAAAAAAAQAKYDEAKAAHVADRKADIRNRPDRHADIFDALDVPHWRGRVSTQHMYNLMGYHGGDSGNPHVLGQQELPEMEQRHDAVPTPKRWEEFAPHERMAVLKAASRFGVTPDSARKALGSQLDQANVREGGHHESFYSGEGISESGGNLPRTQLKESAERNGVSFGVQAMANAITSPSNKFVMRPKTGERAGQTVYPNDDSANGAIQWSQEGKAGWQYEFHPGMRVPPEDKVPAPTAANPNRTLKAEGETRKYIFPGYPSNVSKAIDAVTKVTNGATIEEAWGKSEKKRLGRTDYGDPKTAPFHNSWVDPHGSSQFWVSDTHSGPAAFAPHLTGKDEGAYMGIEGIHAFHDHIARQAMRERGLQSITGTQSQHWSEEKMRSGSASDVTEMTPRSRSAQFEQMPGQGSLFGD
jgi:hypothetical protein